MTVQCRSTMVAMQWVGEEEEQEEKQEEKREEEEEGQAGKRRRRPRKRQPSHNIHRPILLLPCHREAR